MSVKLSLQSASAPCTHPMIGGLGTSPRTWTVTVVREHAKGRRRLGTDHCGRERRGERRVVSRGERVERGERGERIHESFLQGRERGEGREERGERRDER